MKKKKKKGTTGKKSKAPGLGYVLLGNGEIAMVNEDLVQQGLLKDLRDKSIPAKLNEKFKKAKMYRNENSYIQGVVDTIINFTVCS